MGLSLAFPWGSGVRGPWSQASLCSEWRNPDLPAPGRRPPVSNALGWALWPEHLPWCMWMAGWLPLFPGVLAQVPQGLRVVTTP